MCWVMPPASLSTCVGVAKRVEELGLAVVDVTHDGDHRRPEGEVGLVALVLTELEVERLEQLAVLVLGRDDLDDVVELLAEQLERRVVDRLGRGHHLAEAEQHLHELGRVDADPVGEVGQRGTAGQPDGLAVALADAHAADRRGLHGLELLTTGPLRLAATARGTAWTAEGTLGGATLTGTATATRTATATGAERHRDDPGHRRLRLRHRDPARHRDWERPCGPDHRHRRGHRDRGHRGHGHRDRRRRRQGTWASSPGWGAACRDGPRPAGAADAAHRDSVAARGLGAGTRRGAAAHALAGRERVVARTRSAGSAHWPGSRGLGRIGAGLGGRSLGLGRRLRGDRGNGRLGGGRSLHLGGGLGRGLDGLGLGFGHLLGGSLLGGRLLGSRLLLGRAAGAEVSATDFSWSPYSFLNLISTGSSIVEEGDLTNSPISFNFSRTNLLSTL